MQDTCESCSCNCSSHVEEKKKPKTFLIFLMGSLFLLNSFILQLEEPFKIALIIISYLILGHQILIKTVQNIIKGRWLDENFLISIASIGAIAIGEYTEASVLMLFTMIGYILEYKAADSSRKSIKNLLKIRAEYANVLTDDKETRVSPEQVKVGDIVIVRPGEKVPLDGIIIQGKTSFDTAAITGEGMPRSGNVDDEILAGYINQSGVVKMRVTKESHESAVAKIISLVEEAQQSKAPVENFITIFAKYYTPFIIGAAALIATIPSIITGNYQEWVYRSLIFLVISCPCALVISVPLGFFAGLGNASRNGILVKGGNYLSAISKVQTVVFDKTGTLTKGNFSVKNVIPSDGFDMVELLRYAALAEFHSAHPIALAILDKHGPIESAESIEDFEEISGHGTRVKVGERVVLAGNAELMRKNNISFDESGKAGTKVYVAVDGKYAGRIEVADEIRSGTKQALDKLTSAGIKKVVMLTGDNSEITHDIAEELGIKEVHAELLPEDKVDIMRELTKETKGNAMFVGDGINDAPVLACADIGVAMGGIGRDAAVEAADMVLMNDDIYGIVKAIKISRTTNKIVWQNIIISLGVKVLFLTLGILGKSTMWGAVIADVGITVVATLNAIRAARTKFSR